MAGSSAILSRNPDEPEPKKGLCDPDVSSGQSMPSAISFQLARSQS
jgi:hypothetical protein